MSNSPLICCTSISPNKTSPRNHAIDTITIHCYVGQISVEDAGSWFGEASTQASCNYLIDTEGNVALIVDEGDRSWCSSDSNNDNRAITIECASDNVHPYTINDKVYNKLIELCADVCKRNGIKELRWQGDKSLIGQVDKQNMTVHRWFTDKACPGDYLYNLHGQIAREVNEKLNGGAAASDFSYRVQVGAFSVKKNADAMLAKLKEAGFDTYMVKNDGMYKIQVGAFSVKANADAMLKKVKKAGFDAFITAQEG